MEKVVEDEGELVSDFEVILPWEVIETCCSLKPHGTSCFLSVNKQARTSNQLFVCKLEDNSIKIRITVMHLGPETGDRDSPNAADSIKNGETPDLEKDDTPNSTELHSSTENGGNDIDPSNNKVSVKNLSEPPLDENNSPVRNASKRKLKPCIPHAVDSSRLNKRLTEIWKSKRKKVIKKQSTVEKKAENLVQGNKPKTGIKKDYLKTSLTKDESDQPEASEEGLSTVIIVKTVAREDFDGMHGGEDKKTPVYEDSSPAKLENERTFRKKVQKEEKVVAKTKGTKVDAPNRLRNRSSKPGELQVTCELCGEMCDGYGYLFRHVRKQHVDCTFVRNYLDEIRPLMMTPCPICKKAFSLVSSLEAHIRISHPEKPTSKSGFRRVDDLSKFGTNRHQISKPVDEMPHGADSVSTQETGQQSVDKTAPELKTVDKKSYEVRANKKNSAGKLIDKKSSELKTVDKKALAEKMSEKKGSNFKRNMRKKISNLKSVANRGSVKVDGKKADARKTAGQEKKNVKVGEKRKLESEADSDDEEGEESTDFVCKDCGKKFEKRSKLSRHESQTHGEYKYPCECCDKIFRARDNLVKHSLRVHNKRPKASTKPLASSSPMPVKSSLPSGKFQKKAVVEGASIPSKSTSQSKSAPAKNVTVPPKNTTFTCDLCGTDFNRMTLLVTHARYCRQSVGKVNSSLAKA